MSAETYLVIGTGQSGAWTARTLRDEGFAGRIVLIGDERHPPYERPPLSKELLFGDMPVEKTYVFPEPSYGEKSIECRLGVAVTRIEPAAKRVHLGTGETLGYDKLMIATGSRARPLPVPGARLPGVFYLRTIDDTRAIRAAIRPGGNVVVIGAGWIGLEVAAGAIKLGAAVTVVEAADRVCARALTPDLSAYLLARHRAKGADIRLGTGIARITGEPGASGVVLANGTTIAADLVVIGIGIVPNCEIAEAAGLAVDNGIVVDEMGRTSDPSIYAAGDVTNHPNAQLGRRIRLESWENAQNQAINAARAMLGKGTAYAEIPWFWSDQYDLNIQLVGLPLDARDAVTRGDPAADQFITFYLKDGRIDSAAAINAGRDVRFVRRLMQAGKIVDRALLADPATKLQGLLK
ncbi:MAG: pyridine nucleotide-disulfide oxidoreductase [Alphaproteobacteria bacterium]|nr:pyridine nucleotide-disulfide oxidoreductase [Alphaproteobacteria bacterium]